MIAPQDTRPAAAAYQTFAEREMPWLLGEALDDTDRLLRATARTAFQRGFEAAHEPQLIAELQHIVFFHDQLKPEDIARAKALIAKATGEGA